VVMVECGSGGGGGGELEDLLTCGECLEEFPLSDIVRFIRHKVSHGGAERCVTSSPPADADDQDGVATGPGRTAGLDDPSPCARLVCDSSLPGDEAAASEKRLNGDVEDCVNHRSSSSTCAGQSVKHHVMNTGRTSPRH